VAEDAFRQTLAPSQPALPGVAEVFRVVAPIAGAQEGADRDLQQVGQFVLPGAVTPGSGKRDRLAIRLASDIDCRASTSPHSNARPNRQSSPPSGRQP
jgi:hypothetical protein